MNERRFVFDVNVIVSALLFPRSNPRQALDIARYQGRILMTDTIQEELITVLYRPKFDKYLTLDDRTVFLTELLPRVVWIESIEPIEECRDSKDNKYLELAVSGRAKYLITGDEDLLVLHPF
ncbi:putative toxin-antitoxin system toxin component, PIN family [Pannus brasiliensis CCIBt3594]|uniref:Toxin-antitoxin system toxin component, PIN family n=1 Tax=Pannus brasiliensis CCIBt3594 TaxID=1427578 RepID=A0AAW9QQA1_9CHRO